MDDKQKKQMLVMGVLLVVLGGVWYVVLFGFPLNGNTSPVRRVSDVEPDTEDAYNDFSDVDVIELLARVQTVFEDQTAADDIDWEVWEGRDIFVRPPLPTEEQGVELSEHEEDKEQEVDEKEEDGVEKDISEKGVVSLKDAAEADVKEVLELIADIELSGIIWSQQDPVAVINNAVVREGDAVKEDVNVQRITRESAILTVHYDQAEISMEIQLNP